jgi:hypothetical protein
MLRSLICSARIRRCILGDAKPTVVAVITPRIDELEVDDSGSILRRGVIGRGG